MHPHCNAPEVLHATALVQQALMPRILTSSSFVDMRSWRSERSKVSSFATSPFRVQLPASANPSTTLPNHPHARKPNPLKAGARARRDHRPPGLAEGARAAPMEIRPRRNTKVSIIGAAKEYSNSTGERANIR